MRDLEQESGRMPTVDELAAAMGMPPRKIRELLEVAQHTQPTLSLEQPVGKDDDSELASFIENDREPAPTDSTYHKLLKEEIENQLNTLTPREARILKLRYGLGGATAHTLAEIGDKFGLTRERIRQIERHALRRLRHPKRSRELRDFLD